MAVAAATDVKENEFDPDESVNSIDSNDICSKIISIPEAKTKKLR